MVKRYKGPANFSTRHKMTPTEKRQHREEWLQSHIINQNTPGAIQASMKKAAETLERSFSDAKNKQAYMLRFILAKLCTAIELDRERVAATRILKDLATRKSNAKERLVDEFTEKVSELNFHQIENAWNDVTESERFIQNLLMPNGKTPVPASNKLVALGLVEAKKLVLEEIRAAYNKMP